MLERLQNLADRLQNRYSPIVVNESVCFVTDDGKIFQIVCLKDFKVFVIGYADTMEEAEKNFFEDGDLFYMDEFSSEDEMFAAMIKEIEDDY